MTISTSVDFLDTNILVYAVSRRAEDAKKMAAARLLIQPVEQVISLQVLQEFYRVAVHPKKLGFTHDEAVQFCDGWKHMEKMPDIFAPGPTSQTRVTISSHSAPSPPSIS